MKDLRQEYKKCFCLRPFWLVQIQKTQQSLFVENKLNCMIYTLCSPVEKEQHLSCFLTPTGYILVFSYFFVYCYKAQPDCTKDVDVYEVEAHHDDLKPTTKPWCSFAAMSRMHASCEKSHMAHTSNFYFSLYSICFKCAPPFSAP